MVDIVVNVFVIMSKINFENCDNSATFAGTVGTDLKGIIKNLKTGIKYEAKSDELEPQYGWIDVQIGTVS